jgi:hypothetical protein
MRDKQGDLLRVEGKLPGFSALKKTNKPLRTRQESEPS